jgi:hypothetical protein
MNMRSIGATLTLSLLLATSVRAEFRHVEMKTLGMD